MEFAIRGAVGVARTWIERGCDKSVSEMVDLTCQMIEAVRALGIPTA